MVCIPCLGGLDSDYSLSLSLSLSVSLSIFLFSGVSQHPFVAL